MTQEEIFFIEARRIYGDVLRLKERIWSTPCTVQLALFAGCIHAVAAVLEGMIEAGTPLTDEEIRDVLRPKPLKLVKEGDKE